MLERARVILAVLAVSAFGAGSAFACSCMRGPEAQFEKIFVEAMQQPGSVLLEGKVAGSSGGEEARKTTIKVLDAWRGSAGKKVVVQHRTSSAACGVNFQKGESVFILATPSNGGLSVNLCQQLLATRAKGWGKTRVNELLK